MIKKFIRPAFSLLLCVVTLLSIVFPTHVGAASSGYNQGTANEATALSPSIIYKSHVQDIGWMGCMRDGETSGTIGKALRMEAIRIKIRNVPGGVEYSTHVQDIGWMDYAANGELGGTEGRSLRLEAIKIRLTGDAVSKYDVYYRIHAENIGWLDWAENGAAAGTSGFGYRVEAIQIVLVRKGSAAPGPTARPFEKSAAVSSAMPMVALTFDDGPYSVVDSRILNALSANGAHATFFVAGYRIAEYSDTILEIYSQGSEIGNHTYSHHNLSRLSASDIRSEIARTDQLIFNLTGKYPALIRPPEGSYNSTVLNTVDRPLVMWSIDTRDWKTRSTSSTISNVLNNVQDGDIILMHSLYPSTAAACETIIPELVARGYQLVTVSELMAARGVSADAGKVISSARP